MHPTLTSTVTSSLGQANLRSAQVTLPLSLALDPNTSENVCSVTASDSDSCPADTAIGSARVTTPLLNQPLTGTVYLVQGIRTNAAGQQIRTLPALLIPLRGQVALDLRGQTSVDSRSRLVTTFPSAPDVAFSSFVLRITGGRHGILVVTGHANLCQRRQIGLATLGAQSGAVEEDVGADQRAVRQAGPGQASARRRSARAGRDSRALSRPPASQRLRPDPCQSPRRLTQVAGADAAADQPDRGPAGARR